MILSIRAVIATATVGVCGLAVVKGGPAERWGGVFVLLETGALLLSQLLAHHVAPSLAVIAAPALLIDVLLATGFLWLAVRFSNLWLAAAMILQATDLALYGAFLAGGGHHRHDYALALNSISVLLLLVLLGGTLASWRRRMLDRREASAESAFMAAAAQ